MLAPHRKKIKDRIAIMPKPKKQSAKASREEKKEKPPTETVENPKKTSREKLPGNTW